MLRIVLMKAPQKKLRLVLTWNVCLIELFLFKAVLPFNRVNRKQPPDALLNKLIHSPSAGFVCL